MADLKNTFIFLAPVRRIKAILQFFKIFSYFNLICNNVYWFIVITFSRAQIKHQQYVIFLGTSIAFTQPLGDLVSQYVNAYNQNLIDRWMKGCILPFPKKGDLGLAKNYRGITLTSIAAKIYNALLQNRIELKIDKILRKSQNGLRRNRSTTSQILTIRRILEGVRAKNLQATLIFVDFTKAFDSIHWGNMEQILLAYGIPKETVAAITILYRNT